MGGILTAKWVVGGKEPKGGVPYVTTNAALSVKNTPPERAISLAKCICTTSLEISNASTILRNLSLPVWRLPLLFVSPGILHCLEGRASRTGSLSTLRRNMEVQAGPPGQTESEINTNRPISEHIPPSLSIESTAARIILRMWRRHHVRRITRSLHMNLCLFRFSGDSFVPMHILVVCLLCILHFRTSQATKNGALCTGA